MTVKDIVVHLDGEGGEAAALALATALARQHGARLTGLFARNEMHAPAAAARQPSQRLLDAAERARAGFDAATAGLETRWWVIEHGTPGELKGEVVFCCHYADLVVMGRPTAVPSDLTEEVLFKAGRPVLVVPPDCRGRTAGKRAVVGWSAGRGAARALHDALSLFAEAEAVLVATVETAAKAPSTLPQVDIMDHLRRHGLPVSGERLHAGELTPVDTLLSRAYDFDADLLVMGAHAGGPLGRTSPGTRHLLSHAAIPVLFSA